MKDRVLVYIGVLLLAIGFWCLMDWPVDGRYWVMVGGICLLYLAGTIKT